MKYIVFWIVYKLIQVGCPEQWRFDLKWGQGNYDCCVGHFKLISTDYNAGFNTLKEANDFYLKKSKECNKSIFKHGGDIDSLRIDSIKIK